MNGSTGIDNGVAGGTGTVISDGTSIVSDEIAPDIFISGIEKYPVPIYVAVVNGGEMIIKLGSIPKNKY